MARLRDDEVEIRRVSQALDRGNEIWKSWCFQKLGQFIESGGDEGVFSVPAEALGEIPTMRQRYQDEVGATVSVGLGHSISEASKALLAAKLRGKNRVVTYDSTVELDVAAAKQQSTQQKEGAELFTSGLAKGGSAGPDSHVGGFEGAVSQTPDHSEGQVARAEGPQSLSPVDRAHAMAQTSARADRASAIQDSGKLRQVKDQVSQALADIQKQLPVLAEIKTAAPDAYKAVVSLTQAVVALGREVVGAGQDLQKAQSAAKVWRAQGWGPGTGLTIPGDAHPNRAAYDAAYHNAVAAHYANGDRNAVKPLRVPVADVEPNNEVKDQDRFKLYRRMLRAGDRVPPIVVVPKPGGGYRSPDGSHRLHAAVAEGVSHLDALVVGGAGQRINKFEDFDAIAVPGFEIAWCPEFEEDLQKALPRKARKEEADPSKTPAAGAELDKGLGEGAPVGTVLDGKVRVRHWSGEVGWKGARAGRILGKDPASHAVSAREPGAR